MKLHFTAFGRPVPKARPRLGRGGFVFTPKTTQDYERLIADAAREALSQKTGWPMAALYKVTVHAVLQDRRRCDIDNIYKAVGDGLNGVAYFDDCMVCELAISRSYDKASPRTEVTVEVVGDVDSKTAESMRTLHEKTLAKKRAPKKSSSGRKKHFPRRRRPA